MATSNKIVKYESQVSSAKSWNQNRSHCFWWIFFGTIIFLFNRISSSVSVRLENKIISFMYYLQYQVRGPFFGFWIFFSDIILFVYPKIAHIANCVMILAIRFLLRIHWRLLKILKTSYKIVWSNVFWYVKVYIFWKFIQYTLH